MTTNTTCLRQPTSINFLGTELKYYPLSLIHLNTFLHLVSKHDPELRKLVEEAKGTDSRMTILKDFSLPHLNNAEGMIQFVFTLCNEPELYEIIGICFPSFKGVESNKVKVSTLIILFFLIWVTYIPELAKQTVEIGEDLNNPALGDLIAKYTTLAYNEGIKNLNTIQKIQATS